MVLSYQDNIKKRGKYLIETNAKDSFDQNLVKLFDDHGTDWKSYLYDYYNDNKIVPTQDDFEHIIDMLVIYYYETNTARSRQIADDMQSLCTELDKCNYYFSEVEAAYCIDYGLVLNDFRVGRTNSLEYKKLVKMVRRYFVEGGLCIPKEYFEILNDKMLNSLQQMSHAHDYSNFDNYFASVKPNIDHLKVFVDYTQWMGGPKYRDGFRYFLRKGIIPDDDLIEEMDLSDASRRFVKYTKEQMERKNKCKIKSK